jgi:hypothetical protein
VLPYLSDGCKIKKYRKPETMKRLTLILFSSIACFPAIAQLSNYTFIREGGQMSYIDSAAAGVIHHTVDDDMVVPAKVKLGFSFTFNGDTYDSIGISENGFVWFGPAQASDLDGITNPLTQTLPASVKGVICGFGVDLHPHVNTSLTTTIRSYSEPFAGRIDNFRVEWRNTSRFDALSDTQGEDTLNFQIQIFPHEDDRVQVTYWNMGLNPNVTSNLTVGLRGASATDYALRMTDATHTWDNTLEGTSVNSTCELSAVSNPSMVPHNYMSWVNRGTVGLKERNATGGVSLYPVPASDVLYIKPSKDYAVKTYEVIDVTGKVVKSGSITALQVPVSDLKPGLYFLKLESTAGTISERFVK